MGTQKRTLVNEMCDVVDKFLEEAGISKVLLKGCSGEPDSREERFLIGLRFCFGSRAENIWMGLGFEKQNMVYNTLLTALNRPLAMGAEVFHVPFGYSEELETALDESEKKVLFFLNMTNIDSSDEYPILLLLCARQHHKYGGTEHAEQPLENSVKRIASANSRLKIMRESFEQSHISSGLTEEH